MKFYLKYTYFFFPLLIANKVENIILYLLKYCPVLIVHLYFFIFQLAAEVIYSFPYLDGDLFLTCIMNIYYLL